MKLRIAIGFIVLVGMVATGTFIFLDARPERKAVREARVHFQNGVYHNHDNNYYLAKEELRKAANSPPTGWEASYYMASALIQLKNYKEAIPYLKRARLLNPKEPKILNALGMVNLKLGRFDRAKGYLDSTHDPRNH